MLAIQVVEGHHYEFVELDSTFANKFWLIDEEKKSHGRDQADAEATIGQVGKLSLL